MRAFQLNAYNFAHTALTHIDPVKGRGVVALRRIKAGALIALFPGAQTFRIPASDELPLTQWPDRHEADEVLIDEAQELMPVSDYAILTPVRTDAGAPAASSASPTGDSAPRGPTPQPGYHYRILDPMADASSAAGAEMRRALAAFRALDAFDEEVVPEAMVPLLEHKAEQLHERLVRGPPLRVLARSRRPPRDAASFEFFLDAAPPRERHAIVMHLPSGALHPICLTRLVNDAAYVRRRIRHALLAIFDVKRMKQLELVETAKALALPDDYPHLAAFVNEPYDSEVANCEFVDPHDWLPRVARLDADALVSQSPHLAALVTAARDRDARVAYLQRQAVFATRDIAKGEELLLRYSRDDDGGGTSRNA